MNTLKLYYQLPPALRQPSRLDIFGIRNIPGELRGKKITAYLRDRGLPNVDLVDDFIQYLQESELKIGTWRAALAGLLLSSELPSVDKLREGLEIFEQIKGRAPQRLGLNADYQKLFDNIGQNLKISVAQNDLFEALVRLRSFVIDDEEEQPGSCIISGALFSLFILSLGRFAGEGRLINDYHVQSVFPLPSGGLGFFEAAGNGTFINRAVNKEKLHFSHVFSFISSLNIFKAGELVNDKEQILALLALAEAINPYHMLLYSLRADVYRRLGQAETAQHNEDYAKAILSWNFEESGSPITFIPKD